MAVVGRLDIHSVTLSCGCVYTVNRPPTLPPRVNGEFKCDKHGNVIITGV